MYGILFIMLKTSSFIISNLKIIYFFYLVLPFIHIIKHRISDTYAYGFIILFIGFTVLLAIFKNRMVYNIKRVYLLWIFFINICFILMYHSLTLIGTLYSIAFFTVSVLFTLLLSFYYNVDVFIKKYFRKISFFYFIIIFLSILIDFMLLKFGLLEFQPMYDELKSGYINRPFGLFGQPSVNSGLLIVFYLFYLYSSNDTLDKNLKVSLFFILTLGVVLQGSGVGFMLYTIYLLFKLRNRKYILFFLIPLISYLIFNNTIEKLSMDYIIYIVDHSFDAYYIMSNFSILDMLFGIATFNSVDSGFIYLISSVGILYTILILFLYMIMVKKVENTNFRMAVIFLIIGSLHYPMMFYSVASFFLPFIYFNAFPSKMIFYTNNEKTIFRNG